MPSATDRYSARDQQDAGARIARRIERELRLRTERRRAFVLAVSLATVGVLLLVSGLSVAMARGARASRSADTEQQQAVPTVAKTDEPAPTEPTTPVSVVADTPTKAAAVQTTTVAAPRPSTPPAAAVKTPARTAPAKRAPTPIKRAARTKPQAGILVRKCAGSRCHSVSEVSRGGLDVESAVGAIEAMTDGGYIKLTSAERAAVIAALTRK